MKMLKLALASVVMFGFFATAQAEDLTFEFRNLTDYDITGLYVSPTSVDNWEENLLEGRYLPANHQVEVVIGDGRDVCEYDIKIVYEDGDTAEDEEIDLCDLDYYEIE